MSTLILAFKKAIKSFYPDGLKNRNDSSSRYCSLIHEKHFDHQVAITTNGKSKRVIDICDEKEDKTSLFFPPKVVVCEDLKEFDDLEVFGPVIPVIILENYKRAVEFIQDRPGPLAAYLFTNRSIVIDHFVNHVDCGSLGVNDCTRQVFNDTLPFGGCGPSGWGQYHGKFGFEAFSYRKAVLRQKSPGFLLTTMETPHRRWKEFVARVLFTFSLKNLFMLVYLFLFRNKEMSTKND